MAGCCVFMMTEVSRSSVDEWGGFEGSCAGGEGKEETDDKFRRRTPVLRTVMLLFQDNYILHYPHIRTHHQTKSTHSLRVCRHATANMRYIAFGCRLAAQYHQVLTAPFPSPSPRPQPKSLTLSCTSSNVLSLLLCPPFVGSPNTSWLFSFQLSGNPHVSRTRLLNSGL